MKQTAMSLKPQDILVLLRLLFWKEDKRWKFQDLAIDLGISLSEIHQAIKRAQLCDLYDPLTRRPKRVLLTEFLCHGLRYVFPARPGNPSRGIPTAFSAPPLAQRIVSSPQDQLVWPTDLGDQEGAALKPLYKTVPAVAKKFPEIYEMLTLLDALRMGKAREREIAKEEIQKRILEA